MKELGYEIATKGTDNHIVLLSLRKQGIDGGRVEHVFNALNISVNKNTLVGDLSAMKPSGLRLGSPAMTTRDCKESDFEKIAEFIDRGVKLSLKYNVKKKLSNFKSHFKKSKEID